MSKNRIYKRPKNGEPIKITARQLERLYDENDGAFSSRQYKDMKRMQLVESSVRDAKWVLKKFDESTLFGVWDKRAEFGRGRRVYIHYEGEEEGKYVFSIAYIPRALTDHDVNEVILRTYFVRRWTVTKRFLWAEPVDVGS